jgi:membrane protein DedA with SNARE-associated domain
VTVLTFIGYFIGENQDLIMRYSHKALIIVLICSALLIMVYIRFHRRKMARNSGEQPDCVD